MLVVLIAANGELVSKKELLRKVWPDTIVDESNLQVHMCVLRKMLGDSRGLIQTVSGRGYRLLQIGIPSATSPKTSQKAEIEAPRRSHGVPHNLPSNQDMLIGRGKAIEDVSQTLASARHVTLVGSGGIGKTCLAIAVARSLLSVYTEGVYLVSLASTSDVNSVLAAFAASLGLTPGAGPLTLPRLSRELAGRRVLFVLDNCEHVLGPAAELAEILSGVSEEARVLATSREPLRVSGEHLYWVPALELPGDDDSGSVLLNCSSIELFIARARSIDARFSSDEKNVQLMGTVCRRLDGIPLAIELAAARAAILGVETLAAHLDDRFNILTGGNRTALPRHQTLKATLDWSYGLLDEAERTTLRRLGILVNSFTVDAAVAIAGDSVLSDVDVVTALMGLVEKSLVVTRMESVGATYRLLETTREYAMQKLDDNGERRLVTLHHARYFLGILEGDESGSTDVVHSFADGWHARMHELLDDLRAALGWALSAKGDEALAERLAVKVVFLLYELSLVDECCSWARRALDVVIVTHQEARSTHCLRVRMQLQAALAAALVYVNGPSRETVGIWSEIIGSAIALGDHAFEARALWGMWNASQSAGASRNALAFAKRFASLCSETGDASGAILGYRLLGIAQHYAGDQQKARASLEQLLQHTEGLQHRLPLGQSVDQSVVGRATLARVLWLQGSRDQALRMAQDSAVEACGQQPAIVACYVLVEALVPLALLSEKRDLASEAIALLQDVSMQAGLNVSQVCARCFDEYLRSLDTNAAPRLEAFRAALNDLEALEFGAPRAMLIGQYCLALGRAGQREQGIATVVAALSRCDETGDHWFVGELRRIHGELLLMEQTAASPPGAVTRDAEACLNASLEDATVQGNRTLQLRAATSLGRLWHVQGRSLETAQLLNTVCSRLTEGLDWDDFKAASRLLLSVSGAASLKEIDVPAKSVK
ncbi:putative ATPase [Paraburkholderia sp. GAS199]